MSVELWTLLGGSLTTLITGLVLLYYRSKAKTAEKALDEAEKEVFLLREIGNRQTNDIEYLRKTLRERLQQQVDAATPAQLDGMLDRLLSGPGPVAVLSPANPESPPNPKHEG